jgi:hypothetical protein
MWHDKTWLMLSKFVRPGRGLAYLNSNWLLKHALQAER